MIAGKGKISACPPLLLMCRKIVCKVLAEVFTKSADVDSVIEQLNLFFTFQIDKIFIKSLKCLYN